MNLFILNNRLVYVGKVKSLLPELRKLPPHKTVLSLIRENLH